MIGDSDGEPFAAPRSSAVATAAVPIAFLLANATSYALLLVAAHRMSSSAYGALSSLLGLLLISTIPMLALQTVSARRAATGNGSIGVVRGTAQVAGLATAAVCVLSPALTVFLHLHDVVGVLLVAATIPATAVLGTAMGIAQGRRRFPRLALLILVATGGRSVGGLLGLLIGNSPEAVLVGVLLGTSLAAGSVVARGQSVGWYRDSVGDPERTGVLREALHAGHAHGTFLLLTSLDVLLARHVLTSTDAGVYAVGSVVTRAAVWLPQSVVMLLFASLAQSHNHRAAARTASIAVLGLGALGVGGTAVLGTLVVSVAGGSKYHRLDSTIWLFALLGALLAVLQLAVLAGLSQRNPRRAGLLWATIVIDLVVVMSTGHDATPTRLVVTLVSVSALSACTSLWLTLRQPVAAAGQEPGEYVGSNPSPNLAETPDGTG